jgi:hypothetical protein
MGAPDDAPPSCALHVLRKEVRQLLRDASNLAMGLLLPGVLILIFGYGLSFDVKDAPVAVVMEDSSPTARDAVAGLQDPPISRPCWVARWRSGTAHARAPGQRHRAHARRLLQRPGGRPRGIQLLVQWLDSNTRQRIVNGYVGSAATWARADRAGPSRNGSGGGTAHVVQRSRQQHLVPGAWPDRADHDAHVGAFLTSMLIAREWERGTLEALFVTPVRPLELLLAKLIPYFCVAGRDRPGDCACWRRASCSTCRCAARCCDPATQFHALPASWRGHGPADFLRHAQPVPGQPGRAAGQLHAGADAVRLSCSTCATCLPGSGVSGHLLPATYFMG